MLSVGIQFMWPYGNFGNGLVPEVGSMGHGRGRTILIDAFLNGHFSRTLVCLTILRLLNSVHAVKSKLCKLNKCSLLF